MINNEIKNWHIFVDSLKSFSEVEKDNQTPRNYAKAVKIISQTRNQ